VRHRGEGADPPGAVPLLARVLPERRLHHVERLVEERFLDRERRLDPEDVHLVVVQRDDAGPDAIEEDLARGVVVAAFRLLVRYNLDADREAQAARLADNREVFPLLHALQRVPADSRRPLWDAVALHDID